MPGIDRFAAFGIDDDWPDTVAGPAVIEKDRLLALIEIPFLAERHYREQYKRGVIAFVREMVFEACRTVLILSFLEQTLLNQQIQPPRQNVTADPQPALKILEAVQPVQTLPDDQRAPPVAENVQRAGDRTRRVAEFFAFHTVIQVSYMLKPDDNNVSSIMELTGQLTERSMKEHKRWMARYGPWALITGASEGIGREFARTLAAAGFNVILVARREERLRELTRELFDHYGTTATIVEADLADSESVTRVIESARDIDVGLLVASAGFGTSGPFVDARLNEELGMLDVNCRATLSMAHAYGRRFVERGRGGIVLLSSIVAFQGVPQSAHYSATKAYVQSLAEALCIEFKPLGVDVIAAAPGPVNSGFARRANMQMGLALDPSAVPTSTLSALGRRMTIRPGWLSKLLEVALKMLPRWGRVHMMNQVMSGMTKHQQAGKPTPQMSPKGVSNEKSTRDAAGNDVAQ